MSRYAYLLQGTAKDGPKKRAVRTHASRKARHAGYVQWPCLRQGRDKAGHSLALVGGAQLGLHDTGA